MAGARKTCTAEPAAGDGVQQPRQQKPEGLFLEKCERFRTELVGMSRTWPLDTEACRQLTQEWWNAETLTNSGFQWTRDKDEQEQADKEAKGAKGAKGEKGEKAAKGGKGSKGGKRGQRRQRPRSGRAPGRGEAEISCPG